jgi:hypothetical protein
LIYLPILEDLMDTCILALRRPRDVRVRDRVGRRIGLSHSFGSSATMYRLGRSQIRARRQGHSMEEEVRKILRRGMRAGTRQSLVGVTRASIFGWNLWQLREKPAYLSKR